MRLILCCAVVGAVRRRADCTPATCVGDDDTKYDRDFFGDAHVVRSPGAVTWFSPGSYAKRPPLQTSVPNLVCAGEQLVAEASPNVTQNERPCIWHAIMKGGCKKDGCFRCKFRKAQIATGKATAPIPAGPVAKLRAACTPAVAELLK